MRGERITLQLLFSMECTLRKLASNPRCLVSPESLRKLEAVHREVCHGVLDKIDDHDATSPVASSRRTCARRSREAMAQLVVRRDDAEAWAQRAVDAALGEGAK